MVGIINVQWFDNPGAVLLCYAIQKKLDELGIQNQIINYVSGGKMPPRERNAMEKISEKGSTLCRKVRKLQRVNGEFLFCQLRERARNYEDFRAHYLRRTAAFDDPSSELLNGYGVYLVGSDVVWKPEILDSLDADVYFLDFPGANQGKKVSFAASIGTSDRSLLESRSQQYQKYIESFDMVSVREQSSAEFLSELSQKNVETLVDPVFLLTKEDYKELTTEKKNRPYIYFYMLSPDDGCLEFANRLSKRTGLPIVFDCHAESQFSLNRFFGKRGQAAVSDGPAEFLDRVLNASYIVTNSFHGTAFSIIFQKKFFTFPCVNNGVDVSLRMQNLLKKLNLFERFAPQWSEDWISAEINYREPLALLQKEIQKSEDFLKMAAEIEK